MPHKNRKVRSSVGSGRHLHVAADTPGQQNAPNTEEKIRAALTDNPGSTSASLAETADLSRSTAAKILARWGRDGIAIRVAGTGPRNPDTWTLAAPDDTQPDATATPSADGPHPPANDTSEATDTAGSDGTTAVPEPADERQSDHPEAPDDAATDTTDHQASPPSDADSTVPAPDTAASVDSANETEPPSADAPADADTTTGPGRRTDKNRLPKGELRALVEEYLTARAGQSFGPAHIGKDLGRSGGAVNNACEKLVTDGYAIKTCEAPKRFAINPAKTDVPETTENAPEPA